jgi:hypothetical protein
MTVCQTHAIEEHALMETIHSLVNATLDTQVIFVRLRSMNVNPILANTMAIAKISLEATDVVAYQELQEQIVK